MAEEQRLKTMQYASNANDWEQWEELVEQCDAKPAPVDPRQEREPCFDTLSSATIFMDQSRWKKHCQSPPTLI